MQSSPISSKNMFARMAKSCSRASGHHITFILALTILILWAITGPIFHFSDTWQLIINTGTTIITFLMVFLIQNTQNRDSEAMHLKLAELIRATEGAHNALLDLEELTEEDLDELKKHYGQLANLSRQGLEKGTPDTDRPEIPSISRRVKEKKKKPLPS
jgi:low affinity Fe/Cu permease